MATIGELCAFVDDFVAAPCYHGVYPQARRQQKNL